MKRYAIFLMSFQLGIGEEMKNIARKLLHGISVTVLVIASANVYADGTCADHAGKSCSPKHSKCDSSDDCCTGKCTGTGKNGIIPAMKYCEPCENY